MSTLNITNGDAAIKVMRQAGVEGAILCWRDVLHEGPVTTTKLEELSTIRASFIAAQGWGDWTQLEQSFRQRDLAFRRCRDHERVVLWFEHDLYDQLQLLQILHWLEAQQPGDTEVYLCCVDEYLGEMTASRLQAIRHLCTPVSVQQKQLARRAWEAFCSADPTDWVSLLRLDTSSLPFLQPAVLRHLQQYPDFSSGLNRTERQIAAAIQAGCRRPFEIFDFNQQADVTRFMGDTPFWCYIERMSQGTSPLLTTSNGPRFQPQPRPYQIAFLRQELGLTDLGEAVAAGEVDWLTVTPLDRWCGGVRLSADNVWRWLDDERTIIKAV